jgi:membrane associated rhomboid family serine protease
MGFPRTHIPLAKQLRLVISLCMLLALIEVLNFFTGRQLNNLGILPRDFGLGFIGIFFAPFLHGSLFHFLSNIFPFAIFSFLLLQHGFIRYLLVSGICIAFGGVLVWLFGREAIHVGASGLIYGYFGYLVAAGIFSRELKLIFISIFVGIAYGGMVFGVLPVSRYISWESHLFGLIVGVICAFWFGRDRSRRARIG